MPRHSHMVITTNFPLEPVLEQYIETYSVRMFDSYEVVFRSEDEGESGEISYIVVFTLWENRSQNGGTRFWDYVGAYCKLNNKYAIAQVVDHIFPSRKSRRRGHVAGQLE